jgi:hypothetical protein
VQKKEERRGEERRGEEVKEESGKKGKEIPGGITVGREGLGFVGIVSFRENPRAGLPNAYPPPLFSVSEGMIGVTGEWVIATGIIELGGIFQEIREVRRVGRKKSPRKHESFCPNMYVKLTVFYSTGTILRRKGNENECSECRWPVAYGKSVSSATL